MKVSLWLVIVDVLSWLMAVFFHAIVLQPSTLSTRELERRAKSGNKEALYILERESMLVRIATLRRVLEVLFWVIAIVLGVSIFGWFVGVSVALLVSLLLDTISRVPVIVRATNKLYLHYEAEFVKGVKDLAWLEWFKGAITQLPQQSAASKEDLEEIIQRSRAVISHDEFLRVSAALQLEDIVVSDVMTPVSVLDTADVNDALGPLVLDDLHKTGHSRFPVIDGDIHHIVGLLYLHEIVNLDRAKKTVKDAMNPKVHYIHENQTLEHALLGFLRTHYHLFIVVNEYRETVGVITLEDVVESVLGKKIVDEFDQFDDLRTVAESNPRKNNLPKGNTNI